MIGMKRRTVLAVNLGVWTMALGSATALAYDATRSPSVARATSEAEPQGDTANAEDGNPVMALETVLYIPEATIIGRVRGESSLIRAPQQPGGIPNVSCDDRRDTDLNSGTAHADVAP